MASKERLEENSTDYLGCSQCPDRPWLGIQNRWPWSSGGPTVQNEFKSAACNSSRASCHGPSTYASGSSRLTLSGLNSTSTTLLFRTASAYACGAFRSHQLVWTSVLITGSGGYRRDNQYIWAAPVIAMNFWSDFTSDCNFICNGRSSAKACHDTNLLRT